MREVLIIIRREFLERVRSRAFVLGTIAFPFFMVAIFVLPTLLEGRGVERHFALVDEAPAPIGERFVQALTRRDTAAGNTYTIDVVPGTFEALRDTLNARVLAEQIDGYVVLPPDIVDGNELVYRARNIVSSGVNRDLANAATEAIQTERLRQAGLERADVATLMRRVRVDDAGITEAGSDGRSGVSTFIFAYIVSFLIYFITAFYGMNVLRSVIEEKTNRIAEVMVSSVRASHLMLGKIVGVGSAALLQVAVWAAAVVVIALRSDLIADRIGIPRAAFAALSIPVGQGILFIVYFVLGFLLFAAVFAAVGAAMTSEQEAQSIQIPVLIPLILPLILSPAIASEPLSPLAVTLGLVPLTSPIAMPVRIAAAPVPGVQIAASVALLVIGLLLAAWIGGKIYRIGILSTGKRPTLREVGRWLREA